MAKTAPNFCFLFYVGDWLGGTQLFTREHKGAYIDLLMAQFGNGHMSLEDIKHVLGEQDYVKLWPKIEPKFTLDEDGLLYNIKLDNEKFKRKKFVDGRNKNLMGSQVEDLVGSHLEDLVEKEKEKETKDVIEPEDVKDIAPVKPKKPKKEKEPKIQYADNVLMTVGEYNQIITKYFNGDKKLMDLAIDKLDSAKLAHDYKYKSDAGAMRTWVVKDIKKTMGGKVSSVTPGNFDSAEPIFAKLLEEKRIAEEREQNEEQN